MADSAPEISLIVGAQRWSNWVSYELDSDYTTPADSWSVEVHNPSPAQWAALSTGLQIVVMVGEVVALRGLLERRSCRRTKAGTVVSLSGRDLAGPLVDCSPGASWSWRSLALATVARQAVAELGLLATVTAAQEALVPRTAIKAEIGETYWQVIDRYARKLRLMPWMSPDGVLSIGRPDYTSAPVATLTHRALGSSTIQELTYNEDSAARFSDVTVVGQAGGSDSLFGTTAAHLKGTARDTGMVAKGLYRPTIIDDGDIRSTTEATARAAWEVSRRQYDSELLQVTVQGHGPTSTTLWAPDQQLVVDDSILGLSGTWWLAARKLTRDRTSGTRAVLSLRRPNTLLPAIA